jgi:hypothetical protein
MMLIVFLCVLLLFSCNGVQSQRLRAPAVPLIVHNPFMSVWQRADNLTDTFATFWGGDSLGIAGLARIDGVTYRYMLYPSP